MSKWIKSWLLPALFFIVVGCGGAHATTIEQISDRTWSLLLHLWQDQPQIQHPAFILSGHQFSAEAELKQTLALAQADPYQAFCRFPARLTYLASRQYLVLPEDRFAHCPELQKFIDHVPFTELELVYASEVLSSASSMLGHIFIKASGQNQRGTAVAHSLAFFTEITTLNPAKLIVESTISGMPGFFSVRPFSTDVAQYRDLEQRNLWQFRLQASAEAKQLLQLHIWELHQIHLTYLFQSFNCATLTLEMLALLSPELMQQRHHIVSPADVVKAVSQQQLVLETVVDPAQPWLFYAMADSMPQAVTQQLDALDSVAAVQNATTALQHPLAAAYTKIHLQQAVQQQRVTEEVAVEIQQLLPTAAAPQMDLSHYKHPALTPQDSAIGVGWQRSQAGSQLRLNWLPAGHYLHGDNRQYLAESELLIGNVAVALDLEKTRIRLDEFTLYAVKALTPDTRAFPAWSGELYMGYRPAYRPDDAFWSTGEISGGAGKSIRLHQDVIGFGLVGAGLSTSMRESRAFLYGKTGLMFDLAGASKLQLQYLTHSGQAKGASAYQDLSATVSWFPAQDQAVHLQWQRIIGEKEHRHTLGVQYYHFY